jgi:hypothetical protein
MSVDDHRRRRSIEHDQTRVPRAVEFEKDLTFDGHPVTDLDAASFGLG